MDSKNALIGLSALGQTTRLAVFRLLVKAGTDGLSAGDIGATLNVRQNTMSTHLAVLTRANMIRNQRDGRSIRYFANFDGIRGLLEFLMEDCCGGAAELCSPVLDAVTCPPTTTLSAAGGSNE